LATFEYQNEKFNVEWDIQPFGVGYRLVSKFDINCRWDTICDTVETARIFRIDKIDQSVEDHVKEQFVYAVKDLADKVKFIYEANHGLLDHNGITIRFKR